MTSDEAMHSETQAPQAVAVMEATLQVAEIGPWLGGAFGAVAAAATAQGLPLTGPPFARYDAGDEGRFRVEAGFPVGGVITATGDVRPATLPGGTVAVTTHVGPYESMEPTYAALFQWVAEQGGQPSGAPWEVYLSDPMQQPDPTTWQTRIVQPYRPA